MSYTTFDMPAGDVLVVIAQVSVAILAVTIVASVIARRRDFSPTELDRANSA